MEPVDYYLGLIGVCFLGAMVASIAELMLVAILFAAVGIALTSVGLFLAESA